MTTFIQKHFALFNIVWFQLYWWLAVVFNNKAIVACAVLFIIHFLLSSSKISDAIVCAISIFGILLDSVLYHFGLFDFNRDSLIIPLWLIMLWPAFILTFNHSLIWLLKLPLILSSLILSVGGALSYFFAYQLDAVSLPYSTLTTILIITVCWLLLMPIVLKLISNLHKK